MAAKEMSDEDFLNYVEAHSDTERALFSGKQIARMLTLAGDEGAAAEWMECPGIWRAVDLREHVDKARRRDGGQGVLALGDPVT